MSFSILEFRQTRNSALCAALGALLTTCPLQAFGDFANSPDLQADAIVYDGNLESIAAYGCDSVACSDPCLCSDPCGGSCGDRIGCGDACRGGLLGGLIKPSDHCFDDFISPMTNPVFFEDPRTLTEARGIFLQHKIPAAALGEDAQLYAVQLRAALSERLSLIATKDGYIVSYTHLTLPTIYSV